MHLLGSRPREPRAGYWRVNGIVAMVVLVVLGFGIGAGYYSYKQPRVSAELRAQMEAAPTTEAGRLDQWIVFGSAQIHHRLSTVARISEGQPWLVTHTVTDVLDEAPEVWGIDVEHLPEDLCRREGMTVVVELPEPRLIARAVLAGDNARHVPDYPSRAAAADPAARLGELARWFLKDLIDALERDIEGAALDVRIGASG